MKLPEGAAGKITEDSTLAAMLDAMVRAYPPDWDHMETWDNGAGGYYAATTLGPETSSPSDPNVSVVRTLVADVDEDGRILSGRLVEFVAPDLYASEFRDYVVQWLSGDFDSMRIVVPEYTIGYASTQAFVYEPGQTPEPVEMELEEWAGMGKTNTERGICWIVKLYDFFCRTDDEGVRTDCYRSPTGYRITCVCISGCGDDDDGGGGGDDGGDDDGCPNGCGDDTGGGDDDDDDDPEDEITFEMACAPQSVPRGGKVSCAAIVTTPEGMDKQRHQFDWSSSIDSDIRDKAATKSETHTNPTSTWSGVATANAKITVLIGEEKFESDVTVTARSDFAPSDEIKADVKYTDRPRPLGLNGFYEPKITSSPAPAEGTGPWGGTYYIAGRAGFSSEIHILNDLLDDGPKYDFPGGVPDNVCPSAAVLAEEPQSYASVNAHCGTSGGFGTMQSRMLQHERGHEQSFNACLAETTVFTTLEPFVSSDKSKIDEAFKKWDEFEDDLNEATAYSRGFSGVRSWWFRRDDSWGRGLTVIQPHGSGSRHKCD